MGKKTKQLNINISEELLTKLDNWATENNLTKTDLIVSAVEAYIQPAENEEFFRKKLDAAENDIRIYNKKLVTLLIKKNKKREIELKRQKKEYEELKKEEKWVRTKTSYSEQLKGLNDSERIKLIPKLIKLEKEVEIIEWIKEQQGYSERYLGVEDGKR